MDEGKGRRLSVAENPLQKTTSAQDRRLSLAADVKLKDQQATSKLFDFEKKRPRSRRQLQADLDGHSVTVSPLGTRNDTPSSHVIHVPSRNTQHSMSRALESSTMTNLDVVNVLTDGHNPPGMKRLASKKSVNLDAKSSHVIPKGGRRSTVADVPHDRRLSPMGNRPKDARRHTVADLHTPVPERTPSINIDPSVAASDDKEEREKLMQLYDMAIDSVERAEGVNLMKETSKQNLLTKLQGARSRSLSHGPGAGLDFVTLKDLETILNDARVHAARKSSTDEHARLDVGSNRAQKRRIEHLEQVLNALKPHAYGPPEFEPAKVLQCRYLRLSKSNVEQMEEMMVASGQDPGIHVHKDVTNLDIWAGLKEERADLRVTSASDLKPANVSQTVIRKPQ